MAWPGQGCITTAAQHTTCASCVCARATAAACTLYYVTLRYIARLWSLMFHIYVVHQAHACGNWHVNFKRAMVPLRDLLDATHCIALAEHAHLAFTKVAVCCRVCACARTCGGGRAHGPPVAFWHRGIMASWCIGRCGFRGSCSTPSRAVRAWQACMLHHHAPGSPRLAVTGWPACNTRLQLSQWPLRAQVRETGADTGSRARPQYEAQHSSNGLSARTCQCLCTQESYASGAAWLPPRPDK